MSAAQERDEGDRPAGPPGYKELLQPRCPFRPDGADFFVVSRYDEVAEVNRRPDTFSNDYRSYFNQRPEVAAILARGVPNVSTLATQDPPEHGRYRALVNRAFTPPRVAAMAERIQARIDSLIDGFIADGRCDLVSQFAEPLTLFVTADQLGVSEAEIPKFKAWSEARVVQFSLLSSLEQECAAAEQRLEFQAYFTRLLEARRADPKEDIVSVLATAKFDDLDRQLDLAEFLSITEQLMTASNLTTTHTFGMGMLMLLRRPKLMAELRSNPDRIPAFIEEALRLESPVSGIWRVTTTDTELGGVDIPAGTAVHLRLAAANRDAEQFEAPDELNLDRKNLRAHQAFGGGPHFCIGFLLARRELEFGFRSLLARLRDIRLAGAGDPPVIPSFTVRGVCELNIEFEPA